MGLPEQARGTAQATVMGVGRPTVEPPQPPVVITQQPVSAMQMPTPGAALTNPAPAAAPCGTKRNAQHLLKLDPHSGEGQLETFLAKFRFLGQCLGWNERDRFHQLCASLTGEAGLVLWDLPSDATADFLIEQLRTRFGNEIHIEHFSAELRARRRRCGEPLQSLYLDIVCMTTLARKVHLGRRNPTRY